MDDRSFDNMVRDFAAATWTRRSLALVVSGVALSLASLDSETEAAQRHQGGRRKSRKPNKGKRGSSGKGRGGSKPQYGRPGDCERPESCSADPATGNPGYVCSDGLCSCGGICCSKGYACFVEPTTPGREVCCFIDGDNSPLPEDEKLVACPGELFDPNTCCERQLCLPDGSCSALTLGRYRRNPR